MLLNVLSVGVGWSLSEETLFWLLADGVVNSQRNYYRWTDFLDDGGTEYMNTLLEGTPLLLESKLMYDGTRSTRYLLLAGFTVHLIVR